MKINLPKQDKQKRNFLLAVIKCMGNENYPLERAGFEKLANFIEEQFEAQEIQKLEETQYHDGLTLIERGILHGFKVSKTMQTRICFSRWTAGEESKRLNRSTANIFYHLSQKNEVKLEFSLLKIMCDKTPENTEIPLKLMICLIREAKTVEDFKKLKEFATKADFKDSHESLIRQLDNLRKGRDTPPWKAVFAALDKRAAKEKKSQFRLQYSEEEIEALLQDCEKAVALFFQQEPDLKPSREISSKKEILLVLLRQLLNLGWEADIIRKNLCAVRSK